MRYANECGITRYVNEQGLKTQLMIPQSLLKAHMGFGSVITSPLSGGGRKFLRSSPKPLVGKGTLYRKTVFGLESEAPSSD